MEIINIIFLDIDGVLNSFNYRDECRKNNVPLINGHWPFDPKCLSNLKVLVEKTNSKIVISSSWRIHEKNSRELLDVFERYELSKSVIGCTPYLSIDKGRGQEIQAFLDNLNINCNFVIIDDDDDMDELVSHLILINPSVGLTEKNVLDAINMLKSKIKIHIKDV